MNTEHPLEPTTSTERTPNMPAQHPSSSYLTPMIRLAASYAVLVIPSPAWAQPPDMGAVVASVADAVCSKQVVLLGELPSHGEARAFQAKAEIVQRLVDRCDADVGPSGVHLFPYDELPSGSADPTACPDREGTLMRTVTVQFAEAGLAQVALHGVRDVGGVQRTVVLTESVIVR